MGAVGMPASMGKRFGARLIDGILLGIPVGILSSVLFEAGTVSASVGQIALQLVFTGIYETMMIGTRGATLGKQWLGIRVVREADGQLLGIGPAALRWLIPWIGILACFVGQLVVFLSPFFDSTKRNQGWHDKVAKDLVIQV
jgi:uncharacterized RDD family membrane protein YckC